jgi:hypothetical protein
MSTCRVHAEIRIDRKPIKSKDWPECDVMKTSVTRAWATRQFRAYLKEFNECDIGLDKVVSVHWEAHYGEEQGFHMSLGHIGGVNGKVIHKTGIFDL